MGLFLGKAAILGLMGAVLGFAVGLAFMVASNGGSFDSSQLYDHRLVLATLLLAPLLSIIASWIPAVTAARNDPAVILQGN